MQPQKTLREKIEWAWPNDGSSLDRLRESVIALAETTIAEERNAEKGLWMLALVHLNKEQRDGVLATYERIKEHQASLALKELN